MSGALAVTAVLLADTKEFTAKMDEAGRKMDALGASGKSSMAVLSGAVSKAATVVAGLGLAIGAYAVDKAVEWDKAVNNLQNTLGLTSTQAKKLGDAVLNISSTTGESNADLFAAFQTAYQGGLKGATAIKAVSDASKLWTITGTSAADSVKTLSAAMGLHLVKTKDITKSYAEMLAASHNFTGGLNAVQSTLQGKVGVALSGYGASLKTILGLTAVFAKVGLPSRSVASVANIFGKLLEPATTVTTSIVNGKASTTESLNSIATAAVNAGVSFTKMHDMITQGNIVGLLQYVKSEAVNLKEPLSQLLVTLFGTQAPQIKTLIDNLQTVGTVTKSINNASPKGLQTSFQTAVKQIEPELHVLEQRFDKLMVQAGKKLLPALSDVEAWATSVFDYFDKHPLVSKIASDAAIGVFGAAVAFKVAQGLSKAVQGISHLLSPATTAITKSTATTSLEYLQQIAANTAKIAGEGGVSDVEGGAGDTALLGGASVLTKTGGSSLIGAAKVAGGIFGAAALATFITERTNTVGKKAPLWEQLMPTTVVANAVTETAHGMDKLVSLFTGGTAKVHDLTKYDSASGNANILPKQKSTTHKVTVTNKVHLVR